MTAIRTLIKEINAKLINGNFEEALKLYTESLRDDNDYWRPRIVSYIVNKISTLKLDFLFTQNLADMIIIDRNTMDVLLVWITGPDISNKDAYNQYTWMESTRRCIEEEILGEYSSIVKVLHVVNCEDTEDIPHVEAENDNQNFYTTTPHLIDFSKYISQSNIPGYFDANDYSELYEFCTTMAYELTDIKPPEQTDHDSSDNQSKQTAKTDKKSIFNILETAPESYKRFLAQTAIALKDKKLTEIFSLSLHSVFVGDQINKLDELSKHFRDALLAGKDDEFPPISIFNYDICDVDDKTKFDTFLEDRENSIIVIKNIETKINPLYTFKKTDLIRILCKHLDTTKNNIFLLSMPKQAWNELISEYPLLRVFFQNIFFFENLSIDNFLSHFQAELQLNGLTIEHDALKLAADFFEFIMSSNKPGVTNFTVSSMLAREARYYYAVRTSRESESLQKMIILDDIQNAVKDEFTLEPKLSLADSIAKVDQLIGLTQIKTRIRDLAALVKVNRLRNNKNTKVSTPLSLNSLFVGNPGTGKTTVAKLMGDIYKSIGVLSSGHVIAVSRQDIIAQWIGHTEQNMLQLINKAHGGILFIDEAYSLYSVDNERDFGKEAINVLVDKLEEIKDHTCVILAGYPEPMKKFLTANPGLASRFPHTLEFKDYTASELMKILKQFIKAENFFMEKDSEELLATLISKLVQHKDKHFGNGRTCRNLFEQLKLIQARRVTYDLDLEDQNLNLFTYADVEQLYKELHTSDLVKNTRSIGFNIDFDRN